MNGYTHPLVVLLHMLAGIGLACIVLAGVAITGAGIAIG